MITFLHKFLLLFFLEIGFHYVALAALQLPMTLLPLPPPGAESTGCMTPHPAITSPLLIVFKCWSADHRCFRSRSLYLIHSESYRNTDHSTRQYDIPGNISTQFVDVMCSIETVSSSTLPYYYYYYFLDRVSLCIPGTHNIDQVGLELRDLPPPRD